MPTRHDVPVRRVVELTVLVVLTLSFDEVPAGHFKEGNASRFVHSRTIFFVLGHNYGIYVWVTNLPPTSKNKWMDHGMEGGFSGCWFSSPGPMTVSYWYYLLLVVTRSVVCHVKSTCTIIFVPAFKNLACACKLYS